MNLRHCAALDGLRGFAALSVVLFHMGHWWNVPGLATNSSYAVDLFFCMSGYVLPLAYGLETKPDLSFGEYAGIRLIRLMPLIILATALSASYVALRLIVKGEPGMVGELTKAIGLGLLSLPDFHAPKAIGGPQIFPLNGPQYTLLLELLISAVWFATRRLPQVPLALTAFAICIGLLAVFGIGGDTPETFWLGFPRVGASFFAGVAFFHLRMDIGDTSWVRSVFAISSLAMVALFFAPSPAELPIVLLWIGLVSPILVLSGAQVSLSTPLRKICVTAGALSYPVYALHYPVFCWVNGALQTMTHGQAPRVEAPVVLVGIVAASALSLRFIDQPVRAALTRALRRYSTAEGAIRMAFARRNLNADARMG